MVDRRRFEEQEKALGVRASFLGRNVVITDHIKDYVMEKLSKIERFHPRILDLHVTLEVQKLMHTVSLLLKLDHVRIKVAATTSDMYASIDRAVRRLQEKVWRWKDQIQAHQQQSRSVVDLEENVLRRPFSLLENTDLSIEEEATRSREEVYQFPQVVGSEVRSMKDLTVEEAVMKMELSEDEFMPFRALEDRKVNIIYRRPDGNYGLIVLPT